MASCSIRWNKNKKSRWFISTSFFLTPGTMEMSDLTYIAWLGFGRLCSKKKQCQNYATFWKLCSLSPKLCYLDFTLILRKIKIISSLTLSILTLMNIHIVHLPVLQSLASQIRMCAHDLAFLSLLTSLCLRHVFWKPSGFWECSF